MTPNRLLDTPLADELSFLVARARTATSAPANRELRPLGLTVRSYSTLALACSGLEPSQREIADFLLLDPSQVVSIVDDLESREIVLRRPSPDDRRIKIVGATDAGRELLRRAEQAARPIEERLVADLTEEERHTLHALLRRIAFAE